jgi:hypothetical protein
VHPAITIAAKDATRIADINHQDGTVFFMTNLRFRCSCPCGPGTISVSLRRPGVPGSAAAIRSLLAPDHFSTKKKIAGTKKIPIALAASIPPITVVPMIWRATEPAPVVVHSGTQPSMNAKDVIKIGRRRSRAPSSAASARGFPFSYSSFQIAK